MTAVPLIRDEAFAWVAMVHRHSAVPPASWKFGVGLVDSRQEHPTLVAVGIAGKPVARGFATTDRFLIEITRVATWGGLLGFGEHSNSACSALYARLCRAAKELGYRTAITYTLAGEPGTSLRAAGFVCTGYVPGREFSCESRPRRLRGETPDRFLWERKL